MNKNSFVALFLGSISAIFLGAGALFMLIIGWDALGVGLTFECIGLLFLVCMLLSWRKIKDKASVVFSKRVVLIIMIGIVGVFVLGFGLCLIMLWNHTIIGSIQSGVGLFMLICLIPLLRGLY